MSKYWLVKTEPSVYSFANLERDGQTVWDGVTNNLAQKHLRSFTRGDRVLVYHTGDEKRIVGIARVLNDPCPDPKQPGGVLVVVDLRAEQPLPRPVSLSEIRNSPAFSESPLVRLPRLSVMPITEEQWEAVMQLSGIAHERATS
ncbi:MAG TPA: EVE domain-containing protein [Acidobacteriota bacterium]|jgi:predicted RNA-binding protein with PUA-like domain|nr:EVE domain-containing protein [Acidobacteriota bacterium]